jgi:hypothetical protein
VSQIQITDPLRFREAMEFAVKAECLDQFAKDFHRLIQVLTVGMKPDGDQLAEISSDFAPHSFRFVIYRGFGRERGNVVLNGGWIYAGPGAPGDGSFPSLSVDLAWSVGQRPVHSWNVHT